jgi:hypothetical protein
MSELPTWPALFTPPAELLGWLDEQSRLHQRDPVRRKHLLTLRWLLLAELDRTAPERPAKPDSCIL